MVRIARGRFEVSLTPQPVADSVEPATLGRLAIAKQFHGDLDATSVGQMLSAGTGVKGSADYVAMERVTGTLDGRTGSFVLQHSGTMDRGAPQLVITIVPDSGAGDLAGISGSMAIEIADGDHSYALTYAVADAG